MSETEKINQQGGSVLLNESITFNEVTKLFSLPIAEAASILGVCTSVLKRICRDNGVVRWPYRKFLAGKTVEEIKRDAARERYKELAELTKASENMEVSATMSPTAVVSPTPGIQLQNRAPISAQDASKLQRGSPMASPALQQQGNKPFQSRQHMFQPTHTKSITTCLDEFKQGFPTNGLSSVSIRWWGSNNEEEPATEEAEKQQPNELANDCVMREEEPDRETEKTETESQGTALLLSVRKRAVEEGRKAVKFGVARSYGSYKLGRKERTLLFRIFKSSFPSEWR
ncbi:uncharacterized protein LOC143861807 [Tasmannia lanceolata]|uniref:uncharacterized protein LOC143861807 n=1 Tax=Tasmannia lanceolata TaxID=3420 RepID=UPI0040636DCF